MRLPKDANMQTALRQLTFAIETQLKLLQKSGKLPPKLEHLCTTLMRTPFLKSKCSKPTPQEFFNYARLVHLIVSSLPPFLATYPLISQLEQLYVDELGNHNLSVKEVLSLIESSILPEPPVTESQTFNLPTDEQPATIKKEPMTTKQAAQAVVKRTICHFPQAEQSSPFALHPRKSQSPEALPTAFLQGILKCPKQLPAVEEIYLQALASAREFLASQSSIRIAEDPNYSNGVSLCAVPMESDEQNLIGNIRFTPDHRGFYLIIYCYYRDGKWIICRDYVEASPNTPFTCCNSAGGKSDTRDLVLSRLQAPYTDQPTPDQAIHVFAFSQGPLVQLTQSTIPTSDVDPIPPIGPPDPTLPTKEASTNIKYTTYDTQRSTHQAEISDCPSTSTYGTTNGPAELDLNHVVHQVILPLIMTTGSSADQKTTERGFEEFIRGLQEKSAQQTPAKHGWFSIMQLLQELKVTYGINYTGLFGQALCLTLARKSNMEVEYYGSLATNISCDKSNEKDRHFTLRVTSLAYPRKHNLAVVLKKHGLTLRNNYHTGAEDYCDVSDDFMSQLGPQGRSLWDDTETNMRALVAMHHTELTTPDNPLAQQQPIQYMYNLFFYILRTLSFDTKHLSIAFGDMAALCIMPLIEQILWRVEMSHLLTEIRPYNILKVTDRPFAHFFCWLVVEAPECIPSEQLEKLNQKLAGLAIPILRVTQIKQGHKWFLHFECTVFNLRDFILHQVNPLLQNEDGHNELATLIFLKMLSPEEVLNRIRDFFPEIESDNVWRSLDAALQERGQVYIQEWVNVSQNDIPAMLEKCVFLRNALQELISALTKNNNLEEIVFTIQLYHCAFLSIQVCFTNQNDEVLQPFSNILALFSNMSFCLSSELTKRQYVTSSYPPREFPLQLESSKLARRYHFFNDTWEMLKDITCDTREHQKNEGVTLSP